MTGVQTCALPISMIYSLDTPLTDMDFNLSEHELCFGNYSRSLLQYSDGDEGAEYCGGTADIIFPGRYKSVVCISLWVPELL